MQSVVDFKVGLQIQISQLKKSDQMLSESEESQENEDSDDDDGDISVIMDVNNDEIENESEENSENECDEDELLKDVERDQAFNENLSYLQHLKQGSSFANMNETTNLDTLQQTPKSFIAFEKNLNNDMEEVTFIKKATLLYYLTSEKEYVSTDRNFRFMNNKKSYSEKIVEGDFICVNYKSADHIVQVLSFRYDDGKAFKGDFYSIELAKKLKLAKKVEIFVSFYLRKEEGRLISSKRERQFIKVDDYISHVVIKRNKVTAQYEIIE